MSNRTSIVEQQKRRSHRTRAKLAGTSNRPRLSVHISHLHASAQIIDDANGKTLAAASTVGSKAAKGSLSEKAAYVGAEIAKKGKAAKVKQVVFDRGGKLYHGRVKAFRRR